VLHWQDPSGHIDSSPDTNGCPSRSRHSALSCSLPQQSLCRLKDGGMHMTSLNGEQGSFWLQLAMLMSLARSGEGASVLDKREVEELKHWDSMTLGQKIGDWSLRHEYTLIFGSWAGSLAIAGGIISRNKYQTYPQKVSRRLYPWRAATDDSRSCKPVCGHRHSPSVSLSLLEP
jgi:hypothetical protein